MKKIGLQNLAVARRLFLKNRILLAGESTGGTQARTLMFEMAGGRALVKSEGQTKVLGKERSGAV